jgi:hypothetical protein
MISAVAPKTTESSILSKQVQIIINSFVVCTNFRIEAKSGFEFLKIIIIKSLNYHFRSRPFKMAKDASKEKKFEFEH